VTWMDSQALIYRLVSSFYESEKKLMARTESLGSTSRKSPPLRRRSSNWCSI
jgi:hypothetical protein